MMPPNKDALQRTASLWAVGRFGRIFNATVAAGACPRHQSLSLAFDMAAESGAMPPQTPETTNKTNNRTFAATHYVAALLENQTAVARLGSVSRLPTRGEL